MNNINRVIIIIFVLFLVGIVLSLNQIDEGFKVNSAQSGVINVHGVCQNITNNGGVDVFIPTRAPAEWNSFINNPPSGVVVSYSATAGYTCSGGNEHFTDSCGVMGALRTNCDDSNLCTADSCPVDDCVNTNEPVGTNCGGGNTCDGAGNCVAVACAAGTPNGLCSECDGSGGNQMPADDAACGTIDCDGLNNYYISGTQDAADTSTCYYRDYADLSSNRCEGISNCKDANTADCTGFVNNLQQTADLCKYIVDCTGGTPGSIANYPAGTNCGGSNTCDAAGNCIVACVDECSAVGDRECSGTFVMDCDYHDADACLEWGVVDNCNAAIDRFCYESTPTWAYCSLYCGFNPCTWVQTNAPASSTNKCCLDATSYDASIGAGLSCTTYRGREDLCSTHPSCPPGTTAATPYDQVIRFTCTG